MAAEGIGGAGPLVVLSQWQGRPAGCDHGDRPVRAFRSKWKYVVRIAGGSLIALQRNDGGRGGNPNLPSDAFATGEALYALYESGNVAIQDPVYRRGIDFLLRTQDANGAWHVRSRAVKVMPYFDSDFPFGDDQWISAAGTAWADVALACAQGRWDSQRLRHSDGMRASRHMRKPNQSGKSAATSRRDASTDVASFVAWKLRIRGGGIRTWGGVLTAVLEEYGAWRACRDSAADITNTPAQNATFSDENATVAEVLQHLMAIRDARRETWGWPPPNESTARTIYRQSAKGIRPPPRLTSVSTCARSLSGTVSGVGVG